LPRTFRSGNFEATGATLKTPVASCAVTGFIATDASVEDTTSATTPGVTRKILSQTDGPTPGYETIIVEAEIGAGVSVARHTHPGIESAYIVDGGLELPIEGQPTRALKPGDGFVVPPNTPHEAARTVAKRPRSRAPMSWRRASHSHLRPDPIKAFLRQAKATNRASTRRSCRAGGVELF
jgi:quercetin dioxygenase-like cupin family protein